MIADMEIGNNVPHYIARTVVCGIHSRVMNSQGSPAAGTACIRHERAGVQRKGRRNLGHYDIMHLRSNVPHYITNAPHNRLAMERSGIASPS